MAQVSTATEIVGRRLREVRDERRLSAQALADRCAELGAGDIKRQVITNLENGRRGFVGIDELLVLAYALGVSPLRLFLPLRADERIAITPGLDEGPFRTLLWATGRMPPRDGDPQQWRQANALLSRYQGLRDEIEAAASHEARGRVPAFHAQIMVLASMIDVAVDDGLEIPPLPERWISQMRELKSFRSADAVPVSAEDDIEGGGDGGA